MTFDNKEVIKLLNETYELEDLNTEDNKKARLLTQKIDKIYGTMSLRSKKSGIIMDKIKEMVRGK